MSRTRNTHITFVGVASEETVGVRKATQVLAVMVLVVLFVVPVASAATRPPVQPAQSKQAVHAVMLRGQALNRIYHLGHSGRPSPAQSKQAVHALMLRGQALNRIYHLGAYANLWSFSPAKVKARTALKPTAIKIASNPTGGSKNKVQQVFSIH
jgi:hypothetical protein